MATKLTLSRETIARLDFAGFPDVADEAATQTCGGWICLLLAALTGAITDDIWEAIKNFYESSAKDCSEAACEELSISPVVCSDVCSISCGAC